MCKARVEQAEMSYEMVQRKYSSLFIYILLQQLNINLRRVDSNDSKLLETENHLFSDLKNIVMSACTYLIWPTKLITKSQEVVEK